MEYRCDNCGGKSNRDHVHPESIWLCDRCSIADVDVGKTIVDLKAENERLRGAIEQIIHHPAYHGADALSMVRIAQKALEGGE